MRSPHRGSTHRRSSSRSKSSKSSRSYSRSSSRSRSRSRSVSRSRYFVLFFKVVLIFLFCFFSSLISTLLKPTHTLIRVTEVFLSYYLKACSARPALSFIRQSVTFLRVSTDVLNQSQILRDICIFQMWSDCKKAMTLRC